MRIKYIQYTADIEMLGNNSESLNQGKTPEIALRKHEIPKMALSKLKF
jgi:hypothetical protein